MERFIDWCAYVFIILMATISIILGVIIWMGIEDLQDDMHSIEIMILERD
jgi:hypothetical protein